MLLIAAFSSGVGITMMKIPRRQLRSLLQRTPQKQLPTKRLPWGAIAGVFGFVISIVSFGFSIVAFINSTKQDDDLRVVPNEEGFIFLKGSQVKKLAVQLHDTFTFTNAGNRSVAVTSIALGIQETDSTNACSSLFVTIPDNTFEPFMIKAGEIAIKQLFVPASFRNFKDDEWDYERLEEGATGNPLIVWTCLVVDIVTPDDVRTSVQEPINRWVLELNGKSRTEDTPGKQKALFKRKRLSLF
jgi:hypothetical protein